MDRRTLLKAAAGIAAGAVITTEKALHAYQQTGELPAMSDKPILPVINVYDSLQELNDDLGEAVVKSGSVYELKIFGNVFYGFSPAGESGLQITQLSTGDQQAVITLTGAQSGIHFDQG